MNIHKISLRFPPSSSHLFCAKVPDALIEAYLRHGVVYFREFSELIHLLSVHIAHWLKQNGWNFQIFNSTWTFGNLLGFFLNLKYKVITFSTIWQHTFISTEESCFDITQLPKYLQTLKFWSTAIDRYKTSFPHVQWDCQSTSSLWTLVSELVTAACTSTSLQSAQLGNLLSTHIRSS